MRFIRESVPQQCGHLRQARTLVLVSNKSFFSSSSLNTSKHNIELGKIFPPKDLVNIFILLYFYFFIFVYLPRYLNICRILRRSSDRIVMQLNVYSINHITMSTSLRHSVLVLYLDLNFLTIITLPI